MEYISIKKVMDRGVIKFSDDSIWLCEKHRYKTVRGGKDKAKLIRYYIPLQKLK